ncbi:hypothetical protein BT69DRAFT_1350818 [Atractiella rhizophila]|nr:hypothetical protein BT69DRAFT_1350818 [Atractiella rhizophila]
MSLYRVLESYNNPPPSSTTWDKVLSSLDELNLSEDEVLQNELGLTSSELSQSKQMLESSSQALTEYLTKTSQLHMATQAKELKALHASSHEIYIDLYESLHSGLAVNKTERTLRENLQELEGRLDDLERLKDWVLVAARAEEISEQSCTNIQARDLQSAMHLYSELQNLSNTTSADMPSSALSSLVAQTKHATFLSLSEHLSKPLTSVLDVLHWPSKPIEYLELESKEGKDFVMAWADLRLLSSQEEQADFLPIQALAKPLVLRFRYHFDGNTPTNRPDKASLALGPVPEWYLSSVLNNLTAHRAFITNTIQSLCPPSISAMHAFTQALLLPIRHKLSRDVPQLLTMEPWLLSHLVTQLLQFDEELKLENEGLAKIILDRKEWFNTWTEGEKRWCEDRYFEIIADSQAWSWNEEWEDEEGRGGVKRPSNSAVKVWDLTSQIYERYRSLPETKYQLPFLESVHIPILEHYTERLTRSLDAFESLSYVPGSISSSSRQTSGISGLERLLKAGVSARWMTERLEQLKEDLFWIEMEEIRGVQPFGSLIESLKKLERRAEEDMIKLVVKEVGEELRNYLNGRRWDFTNDDTPETVSPQLLPSLSHLSAFYSLFTSVLRPPVLLPFVRRISIALTDGLFIRLPTFSADGGKQLLFDVNYGFKEATGGKGWEKLEEAASVLSMTDGFQKVVKAAWGEEKELEEIGVRWLDLAETKIVVKRRPECWR